PEIGIPNTIFQRIFYAFNSCRFSRGVWRYMKEMLIASFRVVAATSRRASSRNISVLVPMKTVPIGQILIHWRNRHARRHGGGRIAVRYRRGFQPFFALVVPEGVGNLDESRWVACSRRRVGEGCGSVRRRQGVDERISVIVEARGQTNHIGNRA